MPNARGTRNGVPANHAVYRHQFSEFVHAKAPLRSDVWQRRFYVALFAEVTDSLQYRMESPNGHDLLRAMRWEGLRSPLASDTTWDKVVLTLVVRVSARQPPLLKFDLAQLTKNFNKVATFSLTSPQHNSDVRPYLAIAGEYADVRCEVYINLARPTVVRPRRKRKKPVQLRKSKHDRRVVHLD